MDPKKKLGLSRRDMEWVVSGMLQKVPSDPTALAKHLAEMVMTLIEKNNAAVERQLAERRANEEHG